MFRDKGELFLNLIIVPGSEVLFPEFRMQPYNSKSRETIQYMHTWILKDECVATYIAPITQKMHLINTMSVHGL